MPNTKDNARNELLYVTTTEPVGESAKRLPSNYTQVGLVKSDNIGLSVNMIDANDKDVGIYNEVIPGRITGQISISGNRPKDGNAGQLIIRNALIAESLLYWLKSDNTAGDEAVHGTAYVDNYEEGSDDETVRSFTLSMTTQGQFTFFNINT